MDKSEYVDFLDHAKAMLPALQPMIDNSSREVRVQWFEEVFHPLNLESAKGITRELVREGGLSGYRRDNFLSEYLERSKRHEGVRRASGDNQALLDNLSGTVVHRDPVMRKMLTFVEEKMAEYRKRTGEKYTPGDMISQWAQEASDGLDRDYGEEEEARFECAACQDSGFVTIPTGKHAGAMAACGNCEKHESRQPYRSGRVLETYPRLLTDEAYQRISAKGDQ